ncbi:MAG: hypothetical protein FWH50_01250 [Coriobacteriia bacterium]|nr:hypothetical protein [Coriobacteriia bacterium]
MDNVDLDMKLTDERAIEEIKKLLDFLPEDDEARTSFVNTVAQKLLDL